MPGEGEALSQLSLLHSSPYPSDTQKRLHLALLNGLKRLVIMLQRLLTVDGKKNKKDTQVSLLAAGFRLVGKAWAWEKGGGLS